MSLFFSNVIAPRLSQSFQVVRGDYFLDERKEFSEEGCEELLSVSEYSGVTPRRESLSDGEHLSRAESLEGYRLVKVGDLVMNYMLAWKGAQGVSAHEGITSPAYSVFKIDPNKADKNFVHHLFRSDLFKQYFRSESSGIIESRLRFYPESLRSLKIGLPSLAVQVKTSRYLDYETARIDALVEKKTRFIELLREKRQALITHAVTKGLDPNVKMKDSGVEWLGEVPEHWGVLKLGRHVAVTTGFAFPSSEFSPNPEHKRLLRGVNVGVSSLRWDETVYWERRDGDGLDAFELKQGDLVLGMDRPWISEGLRIAFVEKSDLPCILLQRVASLKSDAKLSKKFLYHVLSSELFRAALMPDMTGLSVPHISSEQITGFMLALPPAREQQLICERLECELSRISFLISKTERSVELLKERRSALITAAVTGQIDLREAV
ncbi:restriction endonuclease subunit S [Herbaspirillum sp. B65]|uniref:restriction endonuclease subunit S n=1 Tax=Herbaspirillum sp. B65 TaxID=137708 RepID=UPI00034499A7|nr:restriction endonuclease subunit S [Herbaspirillum sp. B65]